MAKRKRHILVVDSNSYYIEDIKADPKAELVAPIFATNGVELNQHLSDTTISLMGIFLNPVLPVSFDLSLVRACHTYRPATPIFIIYDNPPPLSDQELEKAGVQQCLKKPISYTEMIDIVDPPLFDPEEALKIAVKNGEDVGKEVSAADSEFKAIRAADFFSGAKSFFDVYVQLNSGKYIKLLNAGDDFSKDRVQSYLEKGVEFFYIRNAAQEFYVSYCDKLASSILKSEQVPEKVKTKFVLNHGQETIDYLKTSGISETNLQHATRFIGHISNLIQQLEMKKVNIIKEFMANLLLYDHGNSTAIIAGLLMKPLGFTDKSIRETIGLACMFHDIGLQGQPEVMQAEDLDEMTDEQKETFYLHPIKSGEILANVPNIDPAVIQAVEQHHERRSRDGYPRQLGAGNINMIAEIVGISDEFIRLMKKAKSGKKVNVAEEMNQKIFNGFSYKVVDAFQVGVFGSKPKHS